MPLRRRKLYDLVLDRWAVARTARRDGAAVHRRSTNVLLNDSLSGFFEKGDPAGDLLGMSRHAVDAARRCPEMRPRIVERLDLTVLPLENGVIDGAPIDARRCSSLESFDNEPKAIELFGQVRC